MQTQTCPLPTYEDLLARPSDFTLIDGEIDAFGRFKLTLKLAALRAGLLMTAALSRAQHDPRREIDVAEVMCLPGAAIPRCWQDVADLAAELFLLVREAAEAFGAVTLASTPEDEEEEEGDSDLDDDAAVLVPDLGGEGG